MSFKMVDDRELPGTPLKKFNEIEETTPQSKMQEEKERFNKLQSKTNNNLKKRVDKMKEKISMGSHTKFR